MDRIHAVSGPNSCDGSYERISVYPFYAFQLASAPLQIRKGVKKTLVAQGSMILFALLIMSACFWRARQVRRTHSHGLYFLSLGNHLCRSVAQNLVAMQMGAIAKDYDIKLIISLGNDYNSWPLLNRTDPFITIFYEDLLAFHSSLNIPWYMASGDYSGLNSLESEIALANSSAHFVMPAPYFKRKIFIPSGGSIDLIFLHTKMLLYDQVQVQWLKQILANSSADWRITIGHHVLLNQLNNLLQPIFLQYGVNAYMYASGHVGEYYEDASIIYIGNGVGGCNNGILKSQDQALWTRHDYDGFILHHVSSTEMEFTFMDTAGNILQRIMVKSKRKATMIE